MKLTWRAVLVSTVTVLLAYSFGARDAAAGLCSAQCVFDAESQQTSCAFGMFAENLCVASGGGECAEFVCPIRSLASLEGAGNAHSSQCLLTDRAPAATAPRAVSVVKLQSRT